MVNNSQGHSAYAENALLVSQMNVRPGSKQACMHNGWFVHNGKKGSHKQCLSHLTIQITQISPRASRLFSLSVVYTSLGFAGNVQTSAKGIKLIAAISVSLSFSLISKIKNLSCRKLLKLPGIYIYSYQSSTVS
jgi:hypothetical protein